MPQDVKELGRKVKAKYPGKYDDLSDDDVGRRVKKKYPGAYDDFTDTPAQQPEGMFSSFQTGVAGPLLRNVVETATDVYNRPLETLERAGRGALEFVSAFDPAGAAYEPTVKGQAARVSELQRRAEEQRPEVLRLTERGLQQEEAKPRTRAGRIAFGTGRVLGEVAFPTNPETAVQNIITAPFAGAAVRTTGQAFRAGVGAVRRTFGKGAAQVIEAEAMPAATARVRESIGEPPPVIPAPPQAPANPLQSTFAKLETDNVEQIGAMIANANRRYASPKNITPEQRISAWEDYNRLKELRPDEQRALSQALPPRNYNPVMAAEDYSRNISDIPAGQPNAQLDANLRELEAFFGQEARAGQAAATRTAAPTGRVVTVGDKTYRLTPEQEARWTSEIDAQTVRNKGDAMRLAAIKRDIVSAPTPKEEAAAIAREATNYKGKSVMVEVGGQQVPATVEGMAFGRVKVRLQDGQLVTVERSSISSPITTPRIAPETAIPAPPTPMATSQYGLGLQGMGQAMGDALRKTLRDSVARTGRLPRAESNSSIGRAYEAVVAGGAPRDVTTLDAVMLSLEGGGASPQIAGRMASMARTPTSPVSLPQLRAEFPGMSKQQFDDEVLKLAEQGQVAIHRHDAPGLLSEAERNAMVKVGNDYYTAATVRGPAVGAPFDALNVAVSNAAESIPRSFAQKAKDELLGLFGVPKALRSTADISYPLRQGALLLLRPFQWRQAGKVWKEMFRGFRTKNFDAIKEAIETHPLAGRMDDAGLYRGTKATGEEAFGQRAGSKISEIVRKTPIVKQSDQAYTAAADTQRVGAFEQYARLIDKAGLSPENALKADKAAAEWINIATGRGSLGKRLDKAMEGLNFFFFSPRYVASRLNVFNPAMYIRNASSPGGRVVLKQQMSDLMQFASVVATTMYLAKQAGADVGLNPNSPDFLKIRVGNWRYDPLAGLQQVMRLIYRVGADIGRAGRGEKPKPGQTAIDIGETFLNYKLSPPAGVFRDFINQRTVDKKPFTTGRAIADLTAPMQWADFVEAYQKEAWGGVLKTSPGAAGVGVQNYAQTPVDAAIERSRPLFTELKRLNKRVSELHKKEGEKDDAFNIRVQQFSQNYTRFGQELLNNPRFQSAPDALKAIALDRLNERAKHITNREFAFPEIELDANIIMDAAEQSKKNPANK